MGYHSCAVKLEAAAAYAILPAPGSSSSDLTANASAQQAQGNFVVPQSAVIAGLGLDTGSEFHKLDEALSLRLCSSIRSYLSEQLRAGEAFGIVGTSAAASTVAQHFTSHSAPYVYAGQFHPTQPSDDANFRAVSKLPHYENIRALIVFCDTSNWLFHYRTLVYVCGFSGLLLFPELALNRTAASALENPAPIITLTFPCSGWGRFMPGFHALLKRLQFSRSPFSMDRHSVLVNPRFVHSHPEIAKDAAAYDIRLIADVRASIERTRYFEHLDIHWPLSIAPLLDIPSVRYIYLTRDPRDWLVSWYLWYRNHYSALPAELLRDNAKHVEIYTHPERQEEALLSILTGSFGTADAQHVKRCPSIATYADNALQAGRVSNVFLVRFRELHHDHHGLFRKLLTWINDGASGVHHFTEPEIEEAVRLGSMEYQSAGEVRLGELDDYVRRGFWMRKGIPGEWTRFFTPKLKAVCKELIGTKLIELGYAEDLSW